MKYKTDMKIAILGGDMRATISAIKLADKVNIYAWEIPHSENTDKIKACDRVTDALTDAIAVILPLPASLDGRTLNCKGDTKVLLDEIIDGIEKDSLIIGGRIPTEATARAKKRGIKVFDYFESESFQIENAYTTAEAALSIAMNNLSKNIKGAKFAITGYGRISKQLASLLRALGARVTVAARKDSDLAWAKINGCDTVKLQGKASVIKLCQGYDVIYNTVPFLLFDEEFLKKTDEGTLLIELASSPGGIDVSAAKKLRSRVLWAASLPGKYAPKSAGELIADCIYDILKTEVGI